MDICMEKLSTVKLALMDAVSEHISDGLETVDTEELGEVIDMIKDICEAEKDCAKACYYHSVTDAMADGEQARSHRMGYISDTEIDWSKWEEKTHKKPTLDDTIDSIKEMWDDADPDLKRQIKNQLTALITEMAQFSVNTFKINGYSWRIIPVEGDDPMLVDRTGRLTLATTDPDTCCIYISRTLQGTDKTRVLIHELGHCILVSYNLIPVLHAQVPMKYWIFAEELVCASIVRELY